MAADKELRKMSRIELIEIIYTFLQKEEELRAQIDDLKGQLEDRQIRTENAGSIADAALQINKIFEAAQSAADQYMESVYQTDKSVLAQQYEEQYRKELEAAAKKSEQEQKEMLEITAKKCREMHVQALEECESLISKTLRDCETMRRRAEQYTDDEWHRRKVRIQKILADARKSIAASREELGEAKDE